MLVRHALRSFGSRLSQSSVIAPRYMCTTREDKMKTVLQEQLAASRVEIEDTSGGEEGRVWTE